MFRENGIDYDKVNYFDEPLSEDNLRSLLKKAGLKPFDVLRKKEPKFKELRISPDTPDDKVSSLIVKNPSFLQRPIVEVGNKAVLARPVEKAMELINDA